MEVGPGEIIGFGRAGVSVVAAGIRAVPRVAKAGVGVLVAGVKTVDSVIAAGAKKTAKLIDNFRQSSIRQVDEFSEIVDSLSASQRRQVKGLLDQIESHKKKLAQFKENPLSMDNKGFLTDPRNAARTEKIIERRVRHLEHEIREFEKQVKDKVADMKAQEK